MPTLNRRDFLKAAAAGAGLLALTGRPGAAPPPGRRPNVIILLTDDQGYADMSCHGNPVLKTPHTDKLHGESVRLTDFHVAPMCTPTRSQLMTGQDALRSGACYVCAGRSLMRRGIPTMAEVFAASGYRTGHFGKWHLGDNYPHLPQHRGFQETVHFLGWGITSLADTWQNDYFDGRFRHNGVLQQYKGYCTDVWFDLAMKWMRERHARGEPFFLYLPTNAPHWPLWVPQKYRQLYKEFPRFFGMIANIDENMGKLDAMLRETGLYDNTILIFLTDNGGNPSVVKLFNAGMRGAKMEYYDGGHRAACFIRWPAGGLRKPGDVGALTQVQDLLPTLIDLCGLAAPPGAAFDGTSLAAILKGTTDTLPDRMLVVQFGQRPAKWTDAAVMWNKWRLVNRAELYDLKTDPGQARNVASRFPDVLARMRNHYEKWWAGIEPTINDFVPVSIGSDQENPVTLTAADWANVYCDTIDDCRGGARRNGPWHVQVEKDGNYEFALCRWPKEAGAAIAAGVPAFKAVDETVPPGKALPIAKARLKIGDVLDESKRVGPQDKEVVFSASLKAGTKTRVQSWFYDAAGRELCGAYFAYVRRL